MVGLLILIVVGLGGLVVITGVIVLVVRLADSSNSQPYVPHAWQIPAVSTTAPGWYPDNGDPNVLRFFDGQAWTSATRPRT